MKLIFAVIQNDDVKPLTRALIENEFYVTRISSSGGFLHGGNTTLMLGISEDRLDDALDIIKEKSSRRQTMTIPSAGLPFPSDAAAMPLQVTVGGATVFILNVEDFKKF